MTETPAANLSSLIDAERTHDETIPTGHAQLDEWLNGGLRPGDFAIVAGYPGAGSSTFALGLARSAAVTHSLGTHVTSLEATAETTARRVLAAESAAEAGHLHAGSLSDRDVERIARVNDAVRAAPMRIIDDCRDLAAIRADAFSFGTTTGSLRLLFVDGAHLLVPAHDYGGRAQFADDFARDLKELATLHHLVVVATVPLELPFADVQRAPLLRDLGKRQSFAAAADVVILVHRVAYFDPDDLNGSASVILAKNRIGRRGTLEVGIQPHYTRFMDYRAS